MKHTLFSQSKYAALLCMLLILPAWFSPAAAQARKAQPRRVDVSVAVVTPDGKPVPNADLTVGEGARHLRADEAGRIVFSVAPRDLVTVSAEGFTPVRALGSALAAGTHRLVGEALSVAITDIHLAAVACALGILALPALCCGMISPYIIRLRIRDVATSGATVGRLYALSTAGSIVGTFLGGFVLISFFASGTILWGVALAGVLAKMLWINAPRMLSTAVYLIMGWSILFDLGPLTRMPAPAIALLAAGGISYTVGGVIYGLKKPNLFRRFGFHELFHCFVMLGTVLHYLVVALYIL